MPTNKIDAENIELIDVSAIDESTLQSYPDWFILWIEQNNLAPPKVSSNNGKALACMLHHPGKHFNRETCDEWCIKFKILTDDCIQLFNKHEQWGLQTGRVRGKYYIPFPLKLSNKHKMRKNFQWDGTEEHKNIEVDKIKSTIQADYVDFPNDQWQLGHKNPESTDNSMNNLVLQPPIQAKYRDNFIFIDTLTKMPGPSQLKKSCENGDINLTDEQIYEYKKMFNELEQSRAS